MKWPEVSEHDPSCEKYVLATLPKGGCWACHAIADARADERKKLSDKLNDLPSLVVNDEIILSLDDFASLCESGEQE